jgi:hypothetical protein
LFLEVLHSRYTAVFDCLQFSPLNFSSANLWFAGCKTEFLSASPKRFCVFRAALGDDVRQEQIRKMIFS